MSWHLLPCLWLSLSAHRDHRMLGDAGLPMTGAPLAVPDRDGCGWWRRLWRGRLGGWAATRAGAVPRAGRPRGCLGEHPARVPVLLLVFCLSMVSAGPVATRGRYRSVVHSTTKRWHWSARVGLYLGLARFDGHPVRQSGATPAVSRIVLRGGPRDGHVVRHALHPNHYVSPLSGPVACGRRQDDQAWRSVVNEHLPVYDYVGPADTPG
jgi:hypothetical protein